MCGVVLRKRGIDIAVLDAHDTEMRVFVRCSTDCVVSRRGSDVKALGARIGCGGNERMAAHNYTIGSHKLACCVEMQLRRTKCCYKGTVVDLNCAQKMRATKHHRSVLGSIPKLEHVY